MHNSAKKIMHARKYIHKKETSPFFIPPPPFLLPKGGDYPADNFSNILPSKKKNMAAYK